MTKAYAYVRCASMDGANESLHRQLALSEKYASENGMELVDTVQDAGVSGHRSQTEGALAGLVEQIKAGVIEPGSYLLIESLDRLSRDWGTVTVLITSITKRGVKIVTVDDGKIFDSDQSLRDHLRSMTAGQIGGWSNSVRVETVRWICKEHAAGVSPLEIARRLNHEGVARPTYAAPTMGRVRRARRNSVD